jgi:hypothetical protein
VDASSQLAILLVDVVGSRRLEDFRSRRDVLLGRLSQEHLDRDLLLTRYTITSWDEFQAIVAKPVHLPTVVWELRREFYPWELKVAIGLGRLDSLPESGQAVNEVSMGEPFLRARQAMLELARPKEKYRVLTRLHGPAEAVDDSLNLIYALVDTLLLKVTERQWETIKSYEEAGKLESAARGLGIDESTASRNLQRGSYWQFVEAREGLRRRLDLYPEVQDSELVRQTSR